MACCIAHAVPRTNGHAAGLFVKAFGGAAAEEGRPDAPEGDGHKRAVARSVEHPVAASAETPRWLPSPCSRSMTFARVMLLGLLMDSSSQPSAFGREQWASSGNPQLGGSSQARPVACRRTSGRVIPFAGVGRAQAASPWRTGSKPTPQPHNRQLRAVPLPRAR